MQDMTSSNDRSIRNIPVSANHRRAREQAISEGETFGERPRRQKRRLFWFLATGVIVICAVFALLLSTFFSGASITVYPRQAITTLNQQKIQAHYDAPVGTLSYQLVTLSQAASTTIPASGQKQVSLAASGQATLYNAYSTANQRLITNTRFAAPDGKIYRIHASVSVPGATKKADGSLAPGTITTTLYADAAGAEYNRGQTTFTIPGFQGQPQYGKFYAQAQSLGGGFIGLQPSVSASDLSNGKQLLQNKLEVSVRAQIQAQIPNGFVLIPNTTIVSFDSGAQTSGNNNTAIISQGVTATVAVVRANDLANAIAKITVTGYQGAPIAFADQSRVNIEATSSSAVALQNAIIAKSPLSLLFSGSPVLVWQFDTAALKNALVGKPKGEFEAIIKTFQPAITRADAKIRPFWQSGFPSDPNKISIKVSASAN